MDEALEGFLWLLGQLKGNSGIMASLTGGVWPVQAPVGTAPPFGVVTPAGGHDVMGSGGYRYLYNGPYQVRLWGYANQSDTLQTVSNAVDALLQRTINSVTPDGLAVVVSCLRDNPLPLLPDWDGQQLRIGVGGLYRLLVHKI